MPLGALELTDAVRALLDAHPTLHVYGADELDAAAIPADADGRVYGHAVLWGGGGFDPQDRLNRGPTSLLWEARVTAAGGTVERCLWAADQIRATLAGQPIPGTLSILMERPTGGGGIPQIERDVIPHRHSLPLAFATRA